MKYPGGHRDIWNFRGKVGIPNPGGLAGHKNPSDDILLDLKTP